jgi:cellulose synthase/poly-beta-1,6-N-acetylglucosamine synthase-like glycosyltransferase
MNPVARNRGLHAAAAGLPSLSVIIPAFNEARYLPETLDRLAPRCG